MEQSDLIASIVLGSFLSILIGLLWAFMNKSKKDLDELEKAFKDTQGPISKGDLIHR